MSCEWRGWWTSKYRNGASEVLFRDHRTVLWSPYTFSWTMVRWVIDTLGTADPQMVQKHLKKVEELRGGGRLLITDGILKQKNKKMEYWRGMLKPQGGRDGMELEEIVAVADRRGGDAYNSGKRRS
ncbi:hypothetical protein CDAR_582951 [Caerostris darwini]|uniref:Uncharacterized protein n=1 Tax=Caerostris darwini TaxID=1538125 RepID=A0AAV4SDL2_9ARAC|nr:hypothetical protein CDAR_582951 [Caerostris darwini]